MWQFSRFKGCPKVIQNCSKCMVLNVKVKMLTSKGAENHETNRYNIKTKTCVLAPGCSCSRISDVTFGPFPVSERFQKRAIQHPNVICLSFFSGVGGRGST